MTGDTDERAGLVVGIDLGGTGTRFVALDERTGEVSARATLPTPAAGTAAEIGAFLGDQLTRLTAGRRPRGVGIGASGPVDLTGVIRNPDTLPAFTGLPVLEMVTASTGASAVIDNDAVCAALGERAVGAARRSARSLHVTLGTGVGVCLLNGDSPFPLADGSHPEGGHISVASATPHCYCGRSACWEQAASRQALQRTAAGITGRNPADHAAISALAERASAGDAAAVAAFEACGWAIADGLGTLLTLYGPSLVVLGGSGARYFDRFGGAVARALDSLDGWVPRASVVRTQLDDHGGAIGAAHLVSASP
jgi:glucokinase